jgi:hypothetical protein
MHATFRRPGKIQTKAKVLEGMGDADPYTQPTISVRADLTKYVDGKVLPCREVDVAMRGDGECRAEVVLAFSEEEARELHGKLTRALAWMNDPGKSSSWSG